MTAPSYESVNLLYIDDQPIASAQDLLDLCDWWQETSQNCALAQVVRVAVLNAMDEVPDGEPPQMVWGFWDYMGSCVAYGVEMHTQTSPTNAQRQFFGYPLACMEGMRQDGRIPSVHREVTVIAF